MVKNFHLFLLVFPFLADASCSSEFFTLLNQRTKETAQMLQLCSSQLSLSFHTSTFSISTEEKFNTEEELKENLKKLLINEKIYESIGLLTSTLYQNIINEKSKAFIEKNDALESKLSNFLNTSALYIYPPQVGVSKIDKNNTITSIKTKRWYIQAQELLELSSFAFTKETNIKAGMKLQEALNSSTNDSSSPNELLIKLNGTKQILERIHAILQEFLSLISSFPQAPSLSSSNSASVLSSLNIQLQNIHLSLLQFINSSSFLLPCSLIKNYSAQALYPLPTTEKELLRNQLVFINGIEPFLLLSYIAQETENKIFRILESLSPSSPLKKREDFNTYMQSYGLSVYQGGYNPSLLALSQAKSSISTPWYEDILFTLSLSSEKFKGQGNTIIGRNIQEALLGEREKTNKLAQQIITIIQRTIDSLIIDFAQTNKIIKELENPNQKVP